MEDKEIVNLLLALSSGTKNIGKTKQSKKSGDGVFECKTCHRRFGSFQALGGHRTSHTRPAVAGHGLLGLIVASKYKKTRVHECGICGRGFSTGQALGGHTRRHRTVTVASLLDGGADKEREFELEEPHLLQLFV